MTRVQQLAVTSLILLITSCAQNTTAQKQGGIDMTFVLMNDVYEMKPLGPEGATTGGLARVATLLKQLKTENPNTYSFLAGDLVSPSALGLAKVPNEKGEKEKLAGKQMIACMNVLGLDFMTFGNHEFDIDGKLVLKRLKESKFQWISSNVFQGDQSPWPNVTSDHVFEVEGLKVGIFAVTLDSTKADYVSYNSDILAVAKQKVKDLKGKGAEVIVALTHLAITQDMSLALEVEGIDLILGGHEHENINVWRGRNQVPILKADANARTVYIVDLHWDGKDLDINPRLQTIDERFPDDPATAAEADKWEELAFDAFRAEDIDPAETVTVAGEDLDGSEAAVRNRPTALTRALADGMFTGSEGVVGTFYNGGSIRIDDTIYKGQTITNYDVLRILPFGGDTISVDVRGDILKRVLDMGEAAKGTGGYLQLVKIENTESGWQIQGKAMNAGATYRVSCSDYLLRNTGDMAFFTDGADGVKVNGPTLSMRDALSNGLRAAYPPQ